MFKKWEDYTELEQLATIYSDVFKSVNGCRPRFDQSTWTVARYEEALERLQEESDEQMAWQREREEIAAKDLEAAIATTMETCKCDRETAWRYLKDAEGDDWYDDGHYEYNNDLPRGYLIESGLEPKPVLGFFEEEEV